MAAVCSEARAHAIKFLRAQIPFVALFRVVLDALSNRDPILEQPVFTDITTVVVPSARYYPHDGLEGYDTPDQVVNIVARVFGSSVKKIILSPRCDGQLTTSDMYWPHTRLFEVLMNNRLDMIHISDRGETAHFLASNLRLHVAKDILDSEMPDKDEYDKEWVIEALLLHTLKLSELVRAAAAAGTLPQLRHLEVEMRMHHVQKGAISQLSTTLRNGIIQVDKFDFEALLQQSAEVITYLDDVAISIRPPR